MISPGYEGPLINPLSRDEGINLTVDLRAAHQGDDYHNADVFGRVIHYGGVNYLEAEMNHDPKRFEAKVEDRVRELKEIIAPHIGRWAAAKHNRLGVMSETGWELWENNYASTRVMHTSGIILGVSGVALDKCMYFDYDHPGRVDEARVASWRGGAYKIGVILDTTHTKPAFCYGVEAPETNRMLVPIRGLPSRRSLFNGIWSWQISGIDKHRIN